MDDDVAIRFLRTILPDQGAYAMAAKGLVGFRATQWAETVEDLWEIQKEADRNGLEVYHAVASFREARNDPPTTPQAARRFGRTHHNALGARVFLCDLDCGPGKPYRDSAEIKAALHTFLDNTGMPVPLVVSSGAGRHAYWVLDRMLPAAEWVVYARAFKALLIREGLHHDTSRTADISSVLRTPGTHNRKRGNAVVGVDQVFLEVLQPIDTDWFIERFLGEKVNGHNFALGAAPTFLKHRNGNAVLTSLLGKPDYPPAYADVVAGGCAQIAALRNDCKSISEPLAHACAGVLVFCEDGREKAREWAAGYGGFSSADTDAWIDGKLDRAAGLSGPTTCERFESLKPETCRGCPAHGAIRTPLSVGRTTLPVKVNGAIQVGPSITQWEHTAAGALKPSSWPNAVIALSSLGLTYRHDIFHDTKIIEGTGVAHCGPVLSDAMIRALRAEIHTKFRFDPGEMHIRAAAEWLCEKIRFHPILDYLDGLRWDGDARIDTWLTNYMRTPDSMLNRQIGRLLLIAAVRRIRHPGTKFDQIVVLEGKEGTMKSSAIKLMFGAENFSDQTILGLSDERVQERIKGKWGYEIADLAGMRKSEVEHVKNFASKFFDETRGAYQHYSSRNERTCVFIATTNNERYLKSQTGNRRFWPIKTGRIDIEKLERDRDQLWAEAAYLEAQGVSIVLPEHLWSDAAEQQERRMEMDGLEDILSSVRGVVVGNEERITSKTVLQVHCGFTGRDATTQNYARVSKIMQRLGWIGPEVVRIGNEQGRGYYRFIGSNMSFPSHNRELEA